MRAAVVDREKTAAEVEQRDLAIADPDGAPFTGRNAVSRGDSDPALSVHETTGSRGSSGMNWVRLTGVRPSCQASLERAFDLRNRSSRAVLAAAVA